MKNGEEGAGSLRSPGAARLPGDITRCTGQVLSARLTVLLCPDRETCLRYLAPPVAVRTSWVDYREPCDIHLPAEPQATPPEPASGGGVHP